MITNTASPRSSNTGIHTGIPEIDERVTSTGNAIADELLSAYKYAYNGNFGDVLKNIDEFVWNVVTNNPDENFYAVYRHFASISTPKFISMSLYNMPETKPNVPAEFLFYAKVVGDILEYAAVETIMTEGFAPTDEHLDFMINHYIENKDHRYEDDDPKARYRRTELEHLRNVIDDMHRKLRGTPWSDGQPIHEQAANDEVSA